MLDPIEVVDESPGDLQPLVNREEEREAVRLLRFDAFFTAAQFPDAVEATLAGLARRAVDHCRDMMQEAAEGLLAEELVVAGMKDEFVPEIVHDAGRHGDRAPT